jgi:glycosyltransferase involved in cell wall biosynthesis
MDIRGPIRILRVIPRYAPAWRYGGSVRFSYDLDAALIERGFSITVYTSDQIDEHHRSPARHERLNDIDVHRFPNPWNYLASQAAWLGLYPRGLQRALQDTVERFDLVHVTEARGVHARWAFAAARASGIPIAWSPLGGLAPGVGIRKPYRRGYDLVHDTSRLVREARVLIAQSAHEAAVFEAHGATPSQITTIGLGVDARWFRTLPARGQFRHAVGIEPDHPVVLFIGRLHPTKGLDVLLKASAIARQTYPTLQVVIIGWDHGALRTVKHLSRSLGLEPSLRILPPAFDVAKVQACVDADVFAVAATTYEEASLAALEAVACGTPCVLTKQCEVPELEAAGGGLVTDCNPEAFAAGLCSVLGGPHRAERARFARERILATQTADGRAEVYAEVFRSIVAAGASEPLANVRAVR